MCENAKKLTNLTLKHHWRGVILTKRCEKEIKNLPFLFRKNMAWHRKQYQAF